MTLSVAKVREDKLTSAGKLSFVEPIVRQINANLKNAVFTSTPTDNRYNLNLAVQYALAALTSTARQTANALESLTSTKDKTIRTITKFNLNFTLEEAIKDAQKIKDVLGNDRGDGVQIGDKLTKALEESKMEIDKLHNNLSTALTSFSAISSAKLVALDDSVERRVESILTEYIGSDDDIKFDTIMTNYKHNTTENSSLQRDITAIQTEIGKTFISGTDMLDTQKLGDYGTDQTLRDESIAHLQQTISHLENLPQHVAEAKVEAVEKMEELRKEIRIIKNMIRNSVEEAINTASTQLDDAMQALRVTVKDAHEGCQTALQSLQTKMLEHARASFLTVTNQVQTLFADTHFADLLALKTLVVEQIAAIENIIKRGLKTGLKGFLKVMYGKDETGGQLGALVKELNANQNVELSSLKLRDYLDYILQFIYFQILNQRDPPKPTVGGDHAEDVKKVQENLDEILVHLARDKKLKIYNYDNKFVSLLSHLSTSLHSLSPSAFANPRHPELLDAVKKGLQGFVEQMERVYVNGYDDGKPINWDTFKLVRPKIDAKKSDGDSGSNEELTDDGRRLSKIFLTLFNIIHEDISMLKYECEDEWSNKKLCETEGGEDNPLGSYLRRCGYAVAKTENSKDGESQCITSMTGKKVLGKLNEEIKTLNVVDHFKTCESNEADKTTKQKKADKFDIFDMLKCFLNHIDKYYDVCHMATLNSTRKPCSVFEMLVWLSGLTHNPAKQDLFINGLRPPFENEVDEAAVSEESFLSLEADKPLSLEAYPRYIPYDKICDAVTYACANAYDVLTTVAGTGDADTIYGSDFCNNSMKFHYPASGEDCLDMLLDILRRVLPTLMFLKNQCKLKAEHHGWYDCEYGMYTAPAKWPCKEHSSDKATSQPIKQPKCQPTCEANSKVNCQPTSPLMSYLNDCLPGHLPHQLSKIGCKYECATCPSTSRKGMPCLTPLGFRCFSGSTKTGKQLCEVLSKFVGIRYLTGLFCLVPTPPSTLAEHFGFSLSLVNGLNAKTELKNDNIEALKNAFGASITKQSVKLYTDQSTLTATLTNAYGSPSPKHGKCTAAHLRNLVTSDSCKDKDNLELECGSYISTLCRHSHRYLAEKHASLYLSWAVYLPWSFWANLKNLYDAFCNIYCQDWGCRGCLRGDKCKRGDHGSISDASKKPNCQCHSIVDCKGVAPTLYSYGFSFGDPSKLQNKNYPNTCADFCKQLKNVLMSDYFTKLFKECDKFLFIIRAPFIWLNVALWSLSLFYLLHVMVIRLDLLHFKSHLHSPSSHRIAAQSLLAAARVNKLGRVFYLQP
ncbi:hypothetical protein, conserved [Babesia bigemina]|uniref:C3H1-type domain-containing protein n=1 Tax=Babesia bigemina TaxID=5866 RepID=A0A061BQ98_BABBI|nr:hypothetical protein, conserved [Babesia bigemina]CDR71647.1 hypothetical protein, conserved [Babesia bigemina]|eukprot:XP_012770594.1 hypothetical protein, conserved [Babesia bigemina]